MKRIQRSGLTLVELLVATGIILILVGLLLPATQVAREAARRMSCANNLRNLALACLAHETDHKHYPSNGWGFRWVGDPDRGFGPTQPGGWAYHVLPYLEQEEVHEMGRSEPPAAKRAALKKRFSYAMSVFYCPSRRPLGVYPFTESRFGLANTDVPSSAAKTDYAISAGSVELDGGLGPDSDRDPTYRWPPLNRMNGISFVRSRVRVRDVRDGTSRTIMLGEKHLPIASYTTGVAIGDDQSMYVGDDADIRRYTVISPQPDIVQNDPPSGRLVHAFGSAHLSVTQFAYCDGSVEKIDFEIDEKTFRLMGGRYDGTRAFTNR